MSTIVKDIFDSIQTITESTISYHKLFYVFEPEKEDDRNVDQAYGVVHGPADPAETVFNYYTNDHLFTVKLLRSIVDRSSDAEIQRVINDLYDKADDLLVTFIDSKLNLPTKVLVVKDQTISEPEVLENNAVLLTVNFVVKYRNATS